MKVLTAALILPMARNPVAGSTNSNSFSTLPFDIFDEMVSHFDSTRDKVNLSLTCTSIRRSIEPYLYTSIELLDAKTCLGLVRFLLARPDVCRRVREIVLRPSYLKVATKKRIVSEEKLAREVALLAPNLCALEKFIWDGFEVPESFLWAGLRKNCPRLKSIGANLGRKELDSESELFAFDDLISFSLTTEFHYEDHTHDYNFLRAFNRELPATMWNMLIKRSPRLQALVLGHRGATFRSQRIVDVLPVAGGRWPNLRSLTIENAALFELDFVQRAASIALFDQFVADHPTLQHLALKIRGLNEMHELKSLRSQSLISRGGSLLPTPELHNICFNIRELALTGEAYCGFYYEQLFQLYAVFLPNLQKLSLWIDLSEDNMLDEGVKYDHIPTLRRVLHWCRNLEDLTVMCSTKKKETIQVQDFTKMLERILPRLRRLEIWKVYKSGDDPSKTAAIKFAHANPSLEKVVIRSILKEWRTQRMHILQTGSYRIHRDAEGKPESISANERGGEWLTSMLTRKYQHQIESGKEVEQTSLRERWNWSLRRSSKISPPEDSKNPVKTLAT